MNKEQCPVCGQELPRSLSLNEANEKLRELSMPFFEKEKARIQEEARQKAQKEAASKWEKQTEAERKELAELKRKLKTMEGDVENAHKRGQEQGAQKMRSQLQPQIDKLQRELEQKTSENRGSDAELDLFSALERSFPSDRIERVEKGKKGADIIHRIIENGQELGKIIYECKDVLTWQNAFVAKAQDYQRQYKTSHVLVVSRAFPKKQKEFCVEKGIPIVSPPFAVALSKIIREAVAQIGRLETSQAGRESKARQLYEYITGTEFLGQFRSIAEFVTTLKEYLGKEKEWHENQWRKHEQVHKRFEDLNRKVKTKLDEITQKPISRKLKIVPKASSL